MINFAPIADKKKEDPRYKMAQLLLQPQTSRIEHPLEGLANMAKMAAGVYQSKKLDNEYQQRENQAEDTLTGALTAYGRSQQGGQTKAGGETINWNQSSPEDAKTMLINVLSGNRDTAPMAFDMQMKDMDARQAMAQELAKYKRERSDKAEDFNREAKLKRELAAMKSPGVSVDPETGALTVNPQGNGSYDPAPIAQAVGVPAKPLDTRGLVGKDQQIYTRNARTNAEKRLQHEDMTEAAKQARSNMADSKRFEQLMGEQKTGGLLAIPGVSSVAGWFDPQVREMNAIQDRLTPQQRAPGSGATSNFDAQMFQNALFGANKPPETNQAIIAAMQAKSQDELNFQSFLSDFLDANGHLNGADKAWQDYVENNPIFDPASPQIPTINQNRKSYQEYFGGAAPQNQDQSAQETPRQKLERLRALKGQQ